MTVAACHSLTMHTTLEEGSVDVHLFVYLAVWVVQPFLEQGRGVVV